MKTKLPITGLLLAALAFGCSPAPVQIGLPTTLPLAESFPESVPQPTEARFTPETPAVVDDDVSLWIAPEVPDALRGMADMLSTLEGVVLVEAEADAEVRLEAWGDSPLSVWVYAVVVPFPRTRDDISRTEIQSIWTSQSSTDRIYTSASTAAAMESVLGEPSSSQVQQQLGPVDPDAIWRSRNALAIVPFEELELRWKVLSVDDTSPLQRGFDPSQYPFIVVYGLSGPGDLVERIENVWDWPAINREPQKMTVLTMTGTTALGRTTAARMAQFGIGYPARDILPWLEEADILHISSEVSFADDCPTPDPFVLDLRFCSAPENIGLLELIGADVIELTGNHNMDWGGEAFLYTLELYEARGWETYGGGATLEEAQQGVVLEHNGNRFLFLGCNRAGPASAWAGADSPGAATCDYDVLIPQVAAARDAGIIPVFTFQWYENPTISYALREAAHTMLEAGAVIVSGSQAHQPLGFEFYGDGFVHYGLGNLFFDQMQAEELRREFIDRYIVYDGRVISLELLTAMLEDYARPRPMITWERELLLRDMFEMSGW